MSSFLANPERLFERTWRPRHPLRPKLGAFRRWGMFLLLVFLSTIILGYAWLTNSGRVKTMGEAYLSELLGGKVEIGRANLSIFEGLRLDDVELHVDGSNRPDSLLFTAQSFYIRYNLAELLAGRLRATQIVAIAPKITLVEDPLTRHWNYQRMKPGKTSTRSSPEKPMNISLPEIILRDAQVRCLELRGDSVVALGWYTLEGHLSPAQDDEHRYDFELQSRGRESLGFSVQGELWTDTGRSITQWKNFTAGPEIFAMLRPFLQDFPEEYELQGRLDIPSLSYTPAQNGVPSEFRVEMALQGGGIAVRPQQWMGRVHSDNIQWFHNELGIAQARGWIKPATADTFRRLSTPQSIHLQDVSGTLVFTNKGIDVSGVNGRLENNWFNIDGYINGYSVDAPASVTISSLASQKLFIPPWSPSAIGSMPPEVQEVYEQLRPQGLCSVWVKVDRTEAGARPTVAGQVEILDGSFSFSDFPYPLRKATGKVIIGHDAVKNMDGIRIINVRGCGPEGGANANSFVSVNGFIGPLDQVAGAWLEVHGDNLSSDAQLRAALPAPVDRALRIFDPRGLGEYPKFRGSLTCRLTRPIGPHKIWTIETDVNFDRFEGMLAAFPYPLKDLHGRLEAREGYLDIFNAQMTHGDASLNVNGRVTWRLKTDAPTTRPYGPDLTISARNLPIDDDLLNALPAGQRQRLAQLGPTGKLDVIGHLVPVNPTPEHPTREIDYSIDAKIHDGGLWPMDGGYAVTGLQGKLHITPSNLTLTDVTAQRGQANVKASGEVDWDDARPTISLNASAENLAMEPSLYKILPPQGREGWDAVKPEGTIDASLAYSAGLDDPARPGAAPATRPSDRFELKIKPRELAITPGPLPYRLSNLTGLVTVAPGGVVLSDIKARHGDTAVTFDGHGDLGEHPSWTMHVAAQDLTVDDDLIHAVPESVGSVLKAMNLRGKFAVDFSKLAYRPHKQGAKDLTDADFAAKLTFNGAAMDVGIPLSDVFGTMDLAGLVRDGRLQRVMGQADVQKMMMADRPCTDFKLTLNKLTEEPVLQVQHIEGAMAGGGVAGSVTFSYPDTGASKYDISLVIRDADVQKLTEASTDKKITGRLTASLSMSGGWGDPASRRGHGDVRVNGQDMYDIPIVLGLLQVTDLALPISSPFSEATSRYTIDGPKVTFERIDMKNKEMTMSGSGQLNFTTHQVDLQFVTDNPALVNIPIVGPVIHLAKEELLKIHVTGTIQEPKVTASSFDTIKTTVDRVITGDDRN